MVLPPDSRFTGCWKKFVILSKAKDPGYFFGNSLGLPVKLALIYGWLLLMIRLHKSSRGYELEADKLSASVVGNETFMRAMEKLHEVNFLPRRFND